MTKNNPEPRLTCTSCDKQLKAENERLSRFWDAEVAQLRTDVTTVEAENERLREALERIENPLIGTRGPVCNRIAKRALEQEAAQNSSETFVRCGACNRCGAVGVMTHFAPSSGPDLWVLIEQKCELVHLDHDSADEIVSLLTKAWQEGGE